MPASMPPRLEMVAKPNTIETTFFRLNGEVKQLLWAKLLCRSLLFQLQRMIGHYLNSFKRNDAELESCFCSGQSFQVIPRRIKSIYTYDTTNHHDIQSERILSKTYYSIVLCSCDKVATIA